MIRTFRHKGLRLLFETGSRRGVPPDLAARITRLLDRIDASGVPRDLDLPGFGMHELKGNRKGTWGIKASGNWRITFALRSGDAFDVDLEDYH